MPDPLPPSCARSLRYVIWLDRHRVAVVAASVLVAIGSAVTAAGLPVHSDFSYLLPPDFESVKDLRRLEGRARSLGTLMVAVKCSDPARRAAAARALRDRFQTLGPAQLSSVEFDEAVARRYVWDHRWLFAPLEDLRAARDALAAERERAVARQNPLYIDFEEAAPELPQAVVALRDKLREAEAQKDEPGERVSKDGTLQLLVLRTPYSAGDVRKTGPLLAQVERWIAEVRAQDPEVEVGLAGDVLSGKAEQDAILAGMVLSIVLTVLLCFAALLLYYRTLPGMLVQAWSLAVGTLVTFAFTRATIGHLNIATAFLSSIVMGNGINFGIMLLSRHLEERRGGRAWLEALAVAVSSTLTGTLAASLTASVAYASLVITDFRGFRHFGIIGGAGMVFCWLAAYTVLPALLAIAERRGWIKVRPEPRVGHLLERLLPRRLGWAAAAGALVTAGAGAIAFHYVAGNPYETNLQNLRSDSVLLDDERRWYQVIDEAFGQGISGALVFAVDDRSQAGPLTARLQGQDRLFLWARSIDDLLPQKQPEKLAVLAEIRRLLDPAVLDQLPQAERELALRLRPPEDLRALQDGDIPGAVAYPFVEADGSRGKLVFALPNFRVYDMWDSRDIVRFNEDVRALDLGRGTVLGGQAFVFADMLALMERDGPLTTLAAVIGAVLVVLLIVGWMRHAAITLACGLSGTLLMLALGSLLGLKANFLDFVALPITIGIGIDYAANICSRARLEGPDSARRVIATTGGAVLLCSYTTIVGYGSLLLSVNQGIRSFGTAAILGEITCLLVALILAPALLAVFQARRVKAPPAR
ncbi:MAG: MMPL family transporter [Myxococcales bacterium]